jgi:hypothetical protein
MQTRRLELFTTVRTEGAILPVDLLQRIMEGDSSIDGTSPESYHLAGGEKIGEHICELRTNRHDDFVEIVELVRPDFVFRINSVNELKQFIGIY